MLKLSQREFDVLVEKVRKLESADTSPAQTVIASPTSPVNPRLWQLWYTFSTPALKIWDGKIWRDV